METRYEIAANMKLHNGKIEIISLSYCFISSNSYCKCLVCGEIIVSDGAKMCAEK